MKIGFKFAALLLITSFVLNAHESETKPKPKKCINLFDSDGEIKNICDKDGKQFLLLEFFSAHTTKAADVERFKALEQATKLFAHSRLISESGILETLFFKNHYNISTKISFDLINRAKKAFDVHQLPTIYILNSDNEVVFTHIGSNLSDDEINGIANFLSTY